MRKLKVYVDTSVFSALLDERAPDRRSMTEEFWARRAEFDCITSDLTRAELEQTPDSSRRSALIDLLRELGVHSVSEEITALGRAFLDAKVFPRAMINDAIHVAAAACLGCDVVISWNFKHLVNRGRRAAVNALIVGNGMPSLDIISPPEL